jgi:hypothetical protein
MIHTHQTEIPGLFMNVDQVTKTEEGYNLSGWIGSTINTVEDILIGGISLNPAFYLRTDVSEYYPVIGDLLGFNLTLPFELMNQHVEVKMSNDALTHNTGTKFNQWIIYKSGFGQLHKDIIVVDNFYADPDAVREFAMYNLQFEPSGYHKGQRSQSKYILEGTKERLEQIMGRNIINWNHPNYANGVFQFCTADQPIVYHVDSQMYAAMVYLTPDAPVDTGTALYKSKVTGLRGFPQDGRGGEDYYLTFKGLSQDMNFYDRTQFEKVDDVGNIYNRLVIFNSSNLHAATGYFGDAIENARFFHLFFFDVE